MAGLSTRSRRNTQNNPSDETTSVHTVAAIHDHDDAGKGKSRNISRTTRNPTKEVTSLVESPKENIKLPLNEFSTIETSESNTVGPSASEEVSSNTSESGGSKTSSEKLSSGTSVTSDEPLNKTKEELIKQAHDLDSQFQELITVYKDEKKLFIDKSIHLLETESHPDWLERIEELRKKRHDSIKTATERRRLKVESIMSEYDFVLKNICDEFQAAENEIVDEFTSKRKRRAQKFSGLEKIERAINGSDDYFGADELLQAQNDLSAINRIIEKSHTKIKQEDKSNKPPELLM